MNTNASAVIPCIHSDVDVDALLEMFDAVGNRTAELDWNTSAKLSATGVLIQIGPHALTIEASHEPWRSPRITLSRNDDAIGDVPPVVLIASWRASLAASVHEDTAEALSLKANIGHAADLLVAAGIAAKRPEVHAIACSASSSTDNRRFFLSDVHGPLEIMPETLAWVERSAPRFRILGWGLRAITTHNSVGCRTTAKDLDALKTLRLVADVPDDVVTEVREAPHLT